MKNMKKNILSGIFTFLFFVILAFCYGISHMRSEAYARMGHLLTESTFKVITGMTTGMMVTAIVFIALFLLAAFLAGKLENRGMVWGLGVYSALPLLGLLGLPFAYAGNTGLGMAPTIFLFPWSAPLQPLLLASGTFLHFQTALIIAVFALPLLGLISWYIGNKLAI